MKEWLKLSFWRRRARLLFRIALAIGFIMQSYTFLQMYLRYPSMLQLNVEQPDKVDFPAFTICNLNEIRASLYCKKFPNRCGSPTTYPPFCKEFPEYCRLINDTTKQVPIITVGNYNLTRYEEQTMGHQWQNLVDECNVHIDDEITPCDFPPILVPALSHSTNVVYNCFMFNSLRGKPNEEPKQVPRSTAIYLRLNIEVGEYHPYHLSRGAQISIHSPYHVPSPTSDGQILNLGTIYRFYIKLVRQHLLPAPYESNCTDYFSEWKANGGDGPITNNMCLEKCKMDRSLRMYNCVHLNIDYPHNHTLCPTTLKRYDSQARAECADQCNMPCKLTRFEFQVQEANSEGTRKECLNSTDMSCAILVQLFLQNMEITTFTYRPSFEAVGILSWIGGYVGLWLGISLMTVYDYIEKHFFRLVSFLRKKLKSKQSRRTGRKTAWKTRMAHGYY